MEYLDLFEDNYPNRKDMSDLRLEDLPCTFLTAKIDATGTAATVENNDGFNVANYYVLFEGYGVEKAEIVTFTSVSGANTINHGAVVHSHPIGTKLYLLPYNQIEFSYATSTGGVKSVIATQAMQPDRLATYYRYAAGVSTNCYYTRYKNNASSAFSGYSDEMPGTGFTDYCFRHLVDEIMRIFGSKDGGWITRDLVERAVNEGYHRVAGKLRQLDEGFFVQETPLDLAANTEYVSCPSGFINAIRVAVAYDGTNFYNAKRYFPQTVLKQHSEYSTTDPHYELRGDYIYLNPTPDIARTGGVKLLYSYKPTDMSTGTSTPDGIPSAYARDLLINWGLFRCSMKKGDKSDIILYKGLFNDSLNDMMEELSRRDRGPLTIQPTDTELSEEVYE